MAKILHINETHPTLQVTGNKLGVAFDNTGNVQFSATDTGLKGEVTFPVATTTITGVAVEGNNIKLTKSDGTEETVALPAMPIDVKLANAELTDDNKLKLTLSNGEVKEVELSALIKQKTAQEIWDEIKVLPSFKQDLLELLKGEEIQNFAGETKGYLLASA